MINLIRRRSAFSAKIIPVEKGGPVFLPSSVVTAFRRGFPDPLMALLIFPLASEAILVPAFRDIRTSRPMTKSAGRFEFVFRFGLAFLAVLPLINQVRATGAAAWSFCFVWHFIPFSVV
jgi:hypothetical protein